MDATALRNKGKNVEDENTSSETVIRENTCLKNGCHAYRIFTLIKAAMCLYLAFCELGVM